jgi:prepilin-type N-terminal cleavage/methylation domain-containing protein
MTMLQKTNRGFSILEIIAAIGVLGVASSGTIAVLLQMNQNASLSRLRTGAGTVAQNQIDYLLSIQPFNPKRNQIPPELVVGTRDTGSATNPTVPIYTDPRSGQVSVRGWVRTEITVIPQMVNGVNVDLRRANVTVSYRYRGRTHEVQMSTIRTSDI